MKIINSTNVLKKTKIIHVLVQLFTKKAMIANKHQWHFRSIWYHT